MMHPTLTIAKRIAYDAGDFVLRQTSDQNKIKFKSKSENDFVSEVDIKTEQFIISSLQEAYPDHVFYAEESANVSFETVKNAEHLWIIDPIDGTTNLIKGFPHFAISIAYLKKGKLEVGLVFNPVTDELFTAVRGEGARLNDHKIRTSKILSENAVIATGIPKDSALLKIEQRYLRDIITNFADIRRTGSAALDLCFLAAGRIDGYIEIGLKPWDIAAGVLIAQESGVIISDTSGTFNHLESGNIVAAPPKIYKDLIKIAKQ